MCGAQHYHQQTGYDVGVAPSSVKNILYGKSTDPKISTIKKICDGLDMTLIDFFDAPEFENLEPEIK